MKVSPRKGLLAFGLIALVTTLGACGEATSPVEPVVKETPAPEENTANETPSPEETPEEIPSETPEPGDEPDNPQPVDNKAHTASGSTLKVGETARVLYQDYEAEQYVLDVRVTGAEKGTAEELAELDLGDQIAGYDPYYVNYEVTYADEASRFEGIKNKSLDPVTVRLSDGSRARKVVIFGSYDRCDFGSFKEEHLTEPLKGCQVVLLTDSQTLGTVDFTDFVDPEKDAGKTKYETNNAITWEFE